jgi:hypothetical protein
LKPVISQQRVVRSVKIPERLGWNEAKFSGEVCRRHLLLKFFYSVQKNCISKFLPFEIRVEIFLGDAGGVAKLLPYFRLTEAPDLPDPSEAY